MFLSLRNLARIETADIEINGITVIAGENNSGKSTVGKILFCIFNAFLNVKSKIKTELISEVESRISDMFYVFDNELMLNFRFYEVLGLIKENIGGYISGTRSLERDLRNLLIQYDPAFEDGANREYVDNVIMDIKRIFNISEDEIQRTILRNNMRTEFNMQINNVYKPDAETEIILKTRNTDVKIKVNNNKDIELSDNLNLNTEVIYIDDPHTLDQTMPSQFYDEYTNHHQHLCICLGHKESSQVKEAITEIINAERLKAIYEKMDSVCPGEMVRKGRLFAYEEEGTGIYIDVVNMSAGLKIFAIIKKLLLNGKLKDNGILVLDEPEIHLHPEWQLVFAELIVLIQKEFRMNILINTHSPYFLNAIEVYSQKHGTADKCKYYLAENFGAASKITDVSNDIELIYKKLARPLQKLEDERYSDD